MSFRGVSCVTKIPREFLYFWQKSTAIWEPFHWVFQILGCASYGTKSGILEKRAAVAVSRTRRADERVGRVFGMLHRCNDRVIVFKIKPANDPAQFAVRICKQILAADSDLVRPRHAL